MIDVSIGFPERDIAEFRAQMNRLINELGVAPKEATRQGALALIKSMQASTRNGKKLRLIRRAVESRRKRLNGKRLFVLESLDSATGKINKIPLWFGSSEEAKNHPGRKIRFAGLAKASWGWTAKRLFPNRSKPNVRFSQPRDIIRTSENGSGRGYSITMENSLNYISKTFNTGRGPAVATAAARAAAAMRGRTEQRLKGALK